jgi:hypothetical protein
MRRGMHALCVFLFSSLRTYYSTSRVWSGEGAHGRAVRRRACIKPALAQAARVDHHFTTPPHHPQSTEYVVGTESIVGSRIMDALATRTLTLILILILTRATARSCPLPHP